MKTVLVTGGTVRLGKAIAERLRADGWQVLTSSHRADAGADFVADLSAPHGAEKLYAAVLQRLGGRPPDALVNNAALFAGDDAAVRAVGLAAPKRLMLMMAGRPSGVGAVVNVLDASVGKAGSAAGAAYRAAKRGLLELTLSGARTLAATLRVNAVAPGPVLAPPGVHERAGATLLTRRPLPEDVAAAVAYLLAAEATTGCVIPVDAGQSLLERP
ncbi:MAG: SDR family NAD(P)-dependent oxidoreductase [Kiritimatiellia bacterium]